MALVLMILLGILCFLLGGAEACGQGKCLLCRILDGN